MQPDLLKTYLPLHEEIYASHSSKLYGILLKLSANEVFSQEILATGFSQYFKNMAGPDLPHIHFYELVRIMLRLSSEKLNIPVKTLADYLTAA